MAARKMARNVDYQEEYKLRMKFGHKLNSIAQEMEDYLFVCKSPSLDDQTIFILCDLLSTMNMRNYIGLMNSLKVLSILHPEMASSFKVKIANAAVLHAFTVKDGDSIEFMEEFQEVFGSEAEIITRRVKGIMLEPKPEGWQSVTELIVSNLSCNIVKVVHSILNSSLVDEIDQINDGNHGNNHCIDNEEMVINTNQVLCINANRDDNGDSSSNNNTNVVMSDTEVSADEMSTEIVPTDEEDHHYSSDSVDHSIITGKLEKQIIQEQGDIQNEDHRAEKESDNTTTGILNIVNKHKSDTGNKDHTHASSSNNSSVSDTGNKDHTHASSSNNSSSSVFSLKDRVEIVNPKKTDLSFSSEYDSDVQSEDSFSNVNLLGYEPPTLPPNHKSIWDSELTQQLVDGVNRYGLGKWVFILKVQQFPRTFNNNTLRYKWTNLVKYNHVCKIEQKWMLR